MNVLVTGGTGYLGRAIVRALAAVGHHPIVFARHADTVDLKTAAIAGDIRDDRAVDAAVRQVEAVCHAAALVSISPVAIGVSSLSASIAWPSAS